MRKISICFALILATVLANTNGGYRSLGEFTTRTPSIPDVWSIIPVENPAANRGEYVELVHFDSLTGAEKNWKRVSDGKVWAYVSDSVLYYNYRGTLSRANSSALDRDTLWFYGVHERESPEFNGGHEDRVWYEDLFLLDVKSDRVRFVRPRTLKRILRADPELLEEYKGEDDSFGLMSEYLERYFQRQ